MLYDDSHFSFLYKLLQVARSLVNMHNQVASGDVSYIEELRKLHPVGISASQRIQRPEDGENEESSSSDEEAEEGDAMVGEDMDVDMCEGPIEPKGPIIDDDGFQVVQRKGKGRR